MSDTDIAPSATDPVSIACAIATGKTCAIEGVTIRVRAVHVEYRLGLLVSNFIMMRSRPGEYGWSYFAEDRIVPVKGREWIGVKEIAYGEVTPGDLVARHDYGGPVKWVYLATSGDEPLIECKFERRRGRLLITLPDGSLIQKKNPSRGILPTTTNQGTKRRWLWKRRRLGS
jgi:hypothetical protein